MALQYPILDFPDLPVKSQIFHVPGAALDGGYTSGGARIMSPEPGGRAVLEIQFALHVREWSNPAVSWLMSKLNGEIFRIQLTRTPQLVSDVAGPGRNYIPWAATGMYPDSKWDNEQLWSADGEILSTIGVSLKGTQYISVIVTNQNLQRGHVIGHSDNAYMIDDITYSDDGQSASLRIMPPLRKTTVNGDLIFTRPYFIGTIVNAEEFRREYDIEYVGHIQPGRLIMKEAIVS